MQAEMANSMLSWRNLVIPSDVDLVRGFCAGVGNFSTCEVDLAVELVMESLQRGPDSGYHFLFAGLSATQAGYACYGAIPCTDAAWDLYWLVVDRELQGKGLGSLIMSKAENLIMQAGGRRLYVDTSGRSAYMATRHFYEKCGYKIAAQLPDYYSQGDAKVIYCKDLA